MRIAFRFFSFKRLDDSLVPGQPRSVVGLALNRPISTVGLVRAPTKILCWPPLGPITVCCGPRHWSATATIHCRPHPRSAMIRRWHHPEPATMSRWSGPRPAMMSCRPMVSFWPCTFDWPRPHPLGARCSSPTTLVPNLHSQCCSAMILSECWCDRRSEACRGRWGDSKNDLTAENCHRQSPF